MTGARRWQRAAALVVAVALAAACAVFLLQRGGAGGDTGPAADDLLGSSPLVDDLALDREAVQSSAGTFMDDLSSAQGNEAGAVVELRSDGGLVALASDVLEAYEGSGAARLATSGYLDLAGNAWGAVVVGEDGWVDVVEVYEREGVGVARVVRLVADGGVS